MTNESAHCAPVYQGAIGHWVGHNKYYIETIK